MLHGICQKLRFCHNREHGVRKAIGKVTRMFLLGPFEVPTWVSVALLILVWSPVPVMHWMRHRKKNALPAKCLPWQGVFAIIIGLWLAYQHHPGDVGLTSFHHWYLALIPLLGFVILTMMVAPFVGLRKDLHGSVVVKRALYFLVFVAFPEELWFRGIWFAMVGHAFWPSVLLGSVIFGMMHWSPGVPGRTIDAIPMIVLSGLVFATARFQGAGVLPLALAHGIFDLLNLGLLEKALPHKKSGRPGLSALSIVVFVGGCLLLAALPFAFP